MLAEQLLASLSPTTPVQVLVFHDDASAEDGYLELLKMAPPQGPLAPETAVIFLPGFVQAGVFRFESARRALARRISALARLDSAQPVRLVITSLRGLSRFVPRFEWLAAHIFHVQCGQELEQEQLISVLERNGYMRVQTVEEVGDFAVRGGIVDVWNPGNPHPLRIEIFADEVEKMRTFRPADQRSFADVDHVALLPCREFNWPEGPELESALEHLNGISLHQRLPGSVRADLFENLRNGVPFPGVDDACSCLFPHLYQSGWERLKMACRARNESIRVVFANAPDQYLEAMRADVELYRKAEESAAHRSYLQPRHSDVFSGMKKALVGTGASLPDILGLEADECAPPSQLVLSPSGTVAQALSHERSRKAMGRIEILSAMLQQRSVHQVWIGVRSPDSVPELLGYLSHSFSGGIQTPQKLQNGLPSVFFAADPVAVEAMPCFFIGDIRHPIWSSASGVLVVSESWIRGTATTSLGVASGSDQHSLFPKGTAKSDQAAQKSASRSNAEILLKAQFAEFREGDLIVHVQHGVGRFVGLATVKVGEASGDFLALEYAGKDKLYVPVDKMNVVQRYVGSQVTDDGLLDSLKSSAWEKKRERARKDAEKIARELLAHQARRETAPGYAFGKHDEDMLAFAAAFPYDETPDQLKASREIAEDMSSEQPMDRLLCGDVGFGKTEVAFRAAFRAVLDGRQVAWLVPTTVLAHQHFRSACERFASFGVRVGLLDRSGGTKGQRELLKDLQAGRVDLLIGTHRILSEDVVFRSLGLLVVDEEQRFGVLQKERIKNMSYGVDVLTMTATPIPRTLQMAMLGLRDLSLLTTPPKARLAVKTFVSPFDQDVIRDALQNEQARGGQVFFVHNRVEDLETVRLFLLELVPSMRICVGHGRMSQKDLDRVVIEFLDGKHDLLLCTTIIESGIDMPNVNTILVQDADHFGLSQLYQLRGRVGRRSSRGYAYFLLSPGANEKDEGFKRVEILREHQGLGSGFVIASHDLEMRGAGNIVGDDQSGRVNEVGLETYTQMLDEAIKGIGGVKVSRTTEVDLKLPVEFKIPESYIQSSRERLACYRRFFSTGSEEALENLISECEDRFGPMPQSMCHLGEVARVKLLATRMHATSLVVGGAGLEIRLNPEVLQGHDETADLVRRILDVCNRQVKDVRLTPDGRIMHKGIRNSQFTGAEVGLAFAQLRRFLAAITDG